MIEIDGKSIHLGTFETAELAAEANDWVCINQGVRPPNSLRMLPM